MMQAALGFTLALLISWLAYRFRALDASGLAAAAALGTGAYAAGGLTWSAPLLLFFLSSSLWTRLGSRSGRKQEPGEGSRGRTARQVLANGGPALAAAAVQMILPELGWAWWFYLGSLAAVTADTWATEIGPLFSGPVRLITTGASVPPGTSGGISVPGTLASAAGAAALAALHGLPASAVNQAPGWTAVFLGGLAGSLIDSLLGAAVQRTAFCPSCGMWTDNPGNHPCRTAPERTRGYPWMTNDAVNLICAASGGFLAVILQAARLPF